MLLLKKYPSRRHSTFQPRRRRPDAFENELAESSDSDSESSQVSDPESEEESFIPMKGKLYKQNKQKLQLYFTPGSGREIIENLAPTRKENRNAQRGSLDSQKLDVKKIEYRKKIDIVWNSIISKYSAYDENEQGDIINLKDFSIEEDTGHVETLQNFQRTNIWNDINELEETDDYENRIDPSEDPINLLSVEKISREGSKRPTSQNSRMASPPLKTSKALTINSDHDQSLILTQRKVSAVPTRSSSPRRTSVGRKGTIEPASPMRHTREPYPAMPMERPRIDMGRDPLSLLTPKNSSKAHTRLSSPGRSAPVIKNLAAPVSSSSSSSSSMAPPLSTIRRPVITRQTAHPSLPPTPTSRHSREEDPISLLTPRSRKPTRPSSPTPIGRVCHNPSTAPNSASDQRPGVNRTIRGIVGEEFSLADSHSSSDRQLVTTLPSIRPNGVLGEQSVKGGHSMEDRTRKTTPVKKRGREQEDISINKRRDVRDVAHTERHSSPVRKLMKQLLSGKQTSQQESDPMNLLTPRSTRRGRSQTTRTTTRVSSPLRAKRTPNLSSESDPISLLTPCSLIKKSTSSRGRSGQLESIHKHQQVSPPPFPLKPLPNYESVISNEANSPFISTPTDLMKGSSQQLIPLPMLNPFMFGFPMMTNYFPYNFGFPIAGSGIEGIYPRDASHNQIQVFRPTQ